MYLCGRVSNGSINHTSIIFSIFGESENLKHIVGKI